MSYFFLSPVQKVLKVFYRLRGQPFPMIVPAIPNSELANCVLDNQPEGGTLEKPAV